MDLSIIIVNYNTRQVTLNCLQSIKRSETRYRYDIYVVDNASHDGSVEAIRAQYPEVKLIVNTANVGFAKANNQAMRLAAGRYVLLLNSDTVIASDTLETMVAFMDEQPDVGASGCKVILPDGSLDKACKRGFPTPAASFYYAFGLAKLFPHVRRFNGYHLNYLHPDETHRIDCLVGAFMVVRQEAIAAVGMLDEQFFMYGEDIDWCYRIKQAGWDIVYYPKTTIIHYKGASNRQRRFKIVYEFHRAMHLFHRKHYARHYSFLVNGLVYLGIYTKLSTAILVNSMRRLFARGE